MILMKTYNLPNDKAGILLIYAVSVMQEGKVKIYLEFDGSYYLISVIDNLEDQSSLIGWKNWLLIYWTYGLGIGDKLSSWCSWWLLRFGVDGSVTDIISMVRYWPVLDETV